MRETGRSRSVRKRKERLGNRMAMVGITFVVMSMAVVMHIRGETLREKDLAYQIKEEELTRQLEEESKRAWKNRGSTFRRRNISRRWPRKSWGW